MVTQHLPNMISEVCDRLQDSDSEEAQVAHQTSASAWKPTEHFQVARDLSPRQIELLWNAAKDPRGEILHLKMHEGEDIRVNGKHFLQGANARAAAEWLGALRRLEDHGSIVPLNSGRTCFTVTDTGYECADKSR